MDLAIVAFANILVLYGYKKVNRSLNDDLKILKAIEEEPSRSPSEMKDYFEEIRFIGTKTKIMDEISKMSFIEGRTECQIPINSVINGKTNLIYSAYLKYPTKDGKIMDNMKITGGLLDELINSQLSKKIELIDLHDNEQRCLITGNKDISLSSALELIDFRINNEKLTIIQRIIAYLKKKFIFLGSTMKASEIKWVDYEVGIRVGSPLCVFGNVLYNYKDKTLRIENPLYFLLKNKSDIISQLHMSILGKQIQKLNLIMILINTGLIAGFVLFLWYKRNKAKFSLFSLKRMREIPRFMIQYQCLICQLQSSDLIFEPCNHLCMCSLCFEALRCVKCPQCQHVITNSRKVAFRR